MINEANFQSVFFARIRLTAAKSFVCLPAHSHGAVTGSKNNLMGKR